MVMNNFAYLDIHKSNFSEYIKNIDEFYSNYRLSKTQKNDRYENKTKKNIFSYTIEKPNNLNDALGIINLCEQNYQDGYPYKEMLDPQYVMKSFSDSSFYWGIYRDQSSQCSNETISNIVGSVALKIDKIHKSAYIRGLNITPKAQGKISARKLICDFIWQYLNKNTNIVDKIYCETRTAHIKAQKLAKMLGLHEHAIFMGKDYFLNKKESDVLFVGYSNNSFKTNHIKPAKLHISIYDLYLHISNIHQIKYIPRFISSSKIKIDFKKVVNYIEEIEININEDTYGYKKFTFLDKKMGNYLHGLHTTEAKNIEKLTFHAINSEMMMAFLILLKKYIIMNKIEYVELNIKASDVMMTELLLQNNFKICGYVPAWIQVHENSKYFEDSVYFYWKSPEIEIPALKLTNDGIKIKKILDSKLTNNEEYCKILKDSLDSLSFMI